MELNAVKYSGEKLHVFYVDSFIKAERYVLQECYETNCTTVLSGWQKNSTDNEFSGYETACY